MLSKLFIKPILSDPLRIYYSYSQSDMDSEFLEMLDNHLSLLEKNGIIESWHKKKLLPGDLLSKEVDQHFEKANIILSLISIEYLSQDYNFDIEIKRAMERHACGHVKLIPILLRPVDWQATPFAKIKPLPNNGKPISLWSDKEEAFAEVAMGIRSIVENWHITIIATDTNIEWHLKLDGILENFSIEYQDYIVNRLKEISKDENIEKIGIRSGSVIMILNGSIQSYNFL
jgi:hypothetical protein